MIDIQRKSTTQSWRRARRLPPETEQDNRLAAGFRDDKYVSTKENVRGCRLGRGGRSEKCSYSSADHQPTAYLVGWSEFTGGTWPRGGAYAAIHRRALKDVENCRQQERFSEGTFYVARRQARNERGRLRARTKTFQSCSCHQQTPRSAMAASAIPRFPTFPSQPTVCALAGALSR